MSEPKRRRRVSWCILDAAGWLAGLAGLAGVAIESFPGAGVPTTGAAATAASGEGDGVLAGASDGPGRATMGEISLVRGGKEPMEAKSANRGRRSDMTGDSGISWAAGCGEKPVMQSMTRTVLSPGLTEDEDDVGCPAAAAAASAAVAAAEARLVVAANSFSRCSRLLLGFSRRVVRWIAAYL